MKKMLCFTVLVVLSFTSCMKLPEEKANILIEEYIKSCLFKPETYEIVGTRIDSAFTPYCDPAFHKRLWKLKEIEENIEKCEMEIEKEKDYASNAKSSMYIFDDDYSTLSRYEYQQNKEEYEEHSRKMQEQIGKKESFEIKKKKLYDELQAEISKQSKFIGFQAIHRYRADNNIGQTILGDVYFVFDKDFTQILVAYDMSSEDFIAVDDMIRELKGED